MAEFKISFGGGLTGIADTSKWGMREREESGMIPAALAWPNFTQKEAILKMYKPLNCTKFPSSLPPFLSSS